jgi:HK97 family phage major capsid protein
MAALGTGSTGAGGWTVPSTVTAEFIDRLRPHSVLARSGANFIPLDPGENRMPTVTGDPTAQFLADGASQNETAITFGAADFNAKTIRFVIKASQRNFPGQPPADGDR